MKMEIKDAETAAREFFSLLADGDYQAAQALYSGDYADVRYLNESVPPNDTISLWKNACEVNGYQCLPVKQVLLTEKRSNREFRLTVEFENPDGSIFVLGPCCGASEEEMPSISQFEVFVVKRNGKYLVSSLPVLVP